MDPQVKSLTDGDLDLAIALISRAREHMLGAKKSEMEDQGEIKEMKDKVVKLENHLAEKDKALEMMAEKIEKLKMEKDRLQKNVEVAHSTIVKNLEKIQKLEAINNR